MSVESCRVSSLLTITAKVGELYIVIRYIYIWIIIYGHIISYIIYHISYIVYRISYIVYRVSYIVYRVSCIVYRISYSKSPFLYVVGCLLAQRLLNGWSPPLDFQVWVVWVSWREQVLDSSCMTFDAGKTHSFYRFLLVKYLPSFVGLAPDF